MHSDLINANASLLHHFLNMAKAQRVSHIPAHASQHHFKRVVKPLEDLAQGAVDQTLAEIKHDSDCPSALLQHNQWGTDDNEGQVRSVCVIASSQLIRDAFARQFGAAGHLTSVIDANQNLTGDPKTVHFATMHRAKGLEFDRVIVVTPSAYLGAPMDTDAQRKLIYVALTRAKRDALLLKV
jgi:superfamily I DNA/RNA helicase